MTRHFLRDDDLTHLEQREILELAKRLKLNRFLERPFEGPETVALIFDKSSTRTRVSFAVGVADLGGEPLIIDSAVSQLGSNESVKDTARVLERQVAMIVWRTFSQAGLEEMANHSSVPVINSLSDDFHPCQVLADLLTIQEKFSEVKGRSLCFVGDGSNNMAHSYLLGGATAGMHVRIACPPNYQPLSEVLERSNEIANDTGGSIKIFSDPKEAVLGVDVVATDTWVSMGQESEKEKRIHDFKGFTVDENLMSLAGSEALVLHCLPAYRGFEISNEVLEGPQSSVWNQAENRLHAQKALMVWLAKQSKA